MELTFTQPLGWSSVTRCKMLWDIWNKDCATSWPHLCGSALKMAFRWILKHADLPLMRVYLLPWDTDRGWKWISATILPRVQVHQHGQGPASQPCWVTVSAGCSHPMSSIVE